VTINGVELLTGVQPCFVQRGCLNERRQPGNLLNWPLHMARKTWVDFEDFMAVFTIATLVHKGRYDGHLGLRDIAVVREVIAEDNARRKAEAAASTARVGRTDGPKVVRLADNLGPPPSAGCSS
jgi:hypothetical protein